MKYYYNCFGEDCYYFEMFTAPQIAKHIHLLLAAKKISDISGDKENLTITLQDNDQMVFICTDQNVSTIQDQIKKKI